MNASNLALIELCLPPVLVTNVPTLVMGLYALYRPLHWPQGVPPQAYLGVVTAALALLAFSWSAARLSPNALTVATPVEPLTAVLLAALFLGEHLGAWAQALTMALWRIGPL